MIDTITSRSRILCGIIVGILIVSGLASRLLPSVPGFLRIHAGDALWAAMIYWGVGLLFPKSSIASLVLTALAFSFTIELSQLSSSPLLVQARATRLGALVLGHGFLWIDLSRYILGIVFASFIDFSIARFARRRHHAPSSEISQ